MISIPFFMRETYSSDLTSWDISAELIYKSYNKKLLFSSGEESMTNFILNDIIWYHNSNN